MKYFLHAFLLSFLLSLTACGGGGGGGSNDDGGNDDGGSDGGGSGGDGRGDGGGMASGSHNAGQNCMQSSCHDGGSNAPRFYAAGTVYRSNNSAQSSATVRLYIHNTNTLAAQMSSDANGNFYSTSMVNGLSINGETVTGVDVEVTGPQGPHNMPGVVTNGACNVCHGVDVGRITAN